MRFHFVSGTLRQKQVSNGSLGRADGAIDQPWALPFVEQDLREF